MAKQNYVEDFAVIGVLVAFGMAWALLLIPWLQQGAWFVSLNPVLQYLLYNLGIFGVTAGVFLALFRAFRKGRVKWFQVLLSGLGLWLIESFTLDMWGPPLYLNSLGEVLITSDQALTGTAVDAMVSWVYSSWGIAGTPLFVMVYVVTPISALIIAVVLLHPTFIYKAMGVA